VPAAEAATRDWPAGAPWKFPGLLRPAYACTPMGSNGGTI